MPRFTYMFNSFRAGELGPKTHARTDSEQYRDGLNEMTNFIPYQTGGASRRTGLYAHTVRQDIGTDTVDPEKSFTIPVNLDQNNVYNLTLSFNKDTTNWDTMTVEAMATDYTTVSGSIGATAGLRLNLIDFLTDDGVAGFTWVQVNNMIVITHNSGLMEPLIIYPSISGTSITFLTEIYSSIPTVNNKFIGPDHWSKNYVWVKEPWNDPNATTITLSVAATGIGASTTLSAGASLFTSEDVGNKYILDNGGQTIVCQATAYINATQMTVTIIGKTASYVSASSDYWYEASWSPKNGYPKSVEVHNGRLVFGGNTSGGNTLWASFPFRYGQFSRYMGFSAANKDVTNLIYDRDPANIDGGLQLTINSQGDADNIMWLKSNRSLLVGTRNREYICNLDDPSITPQSNNGSSPYKAENGFNSTFFIGNDGTSIYEVKYSDENGAFVSRELTNLNDEILHKDESDRNARYLQLKWNEHFKTLFCMTTTGRVKAITIEESVGLTAMSSVDIADTIVHQITELFLPDQSFTYPLFKGQNSTITGNGGNEAELFLVMTQRFEGENIISGTNNDYGSFGCYLDLAYAENTPFSASASLVLPEVYRDLTLSFVGEKADGTIIVNENVTGSGTTFALTEPVVKFVAGIPYKSKIETLTPEVGPNQILNSQGDVIRIDRVTAKLYKSWVGKYGSQDALHDFEKLSIQSSYTGEERVDLPIGPDDENRVIIETEKPLPLNVLGLVLRGNNNP